VEPFDRAELNLEPDDFLFLTMLDFNSYVARKNPVGAIKAFKTAFAKGDGRERLIIKTINGHAHPEKLDELLTFVDDDPRIVLMDGPLSRAGTCGLIAAVDCFVSLHRAEGFGRVIAEAMFLGTPVVATDYSGSQTVLDETTGFPVACALREVLEGDYVYPEGSQWAEPDLADAAEKFRIVRSKKALVAKKVAKAKTLTRKNHGLDACADNVLARLATIAGRR
jgi:glycosyltransferase involved in cell wall biosynthesis